MDRASIILARAVALCYCTGVCMHDRNIPWVTLEAIQEAVRDGRRVMGTLAVRHVQQYGYDVNEVWECVLRLDTGCFDRSAITDHPVNAGELVDGYKFEMNGRMTWFKLALLPHGIVKLVSVHPTK